MRVWVRWFVVSLYFWQQFVINKNGIIIHLKKKYENRLNRNTMDYFYWYRCNQLAGTNEPTK